MKQSEEEEMDQQLQRSRDHGYNYKQYPDLLQVMEVVAHSDGNLAGRVAFIRFIVCIDAQHLHRGPPPTPES